MLFETDDSMPHFLTSAWREREKNIPSQRGKSQKQSLSFLGKLWPERGAKGKRKKKKKKVGNNEFIKLKMHRPMERLDFNRRQMEREPPLLLRCSDTAALIAWSCLGDTKSSWAMTWGEQAPGFVVRKNCLFNIHNQHHPSPLPCVPVPSSIPLCWGSACQAARLGCCRAGLGS